MEVVWEGASRLAAPNNNSIILLVPNDSTILLNCCNIPVLQTQEYILHRDHQQDSNGLTTFSSVAQTRRMLLLIILSFRFWVPSFTNQIIKWLLADVCALLIIMCFRFWVPSFTDLIIKWLLASWHCQHNQAANVLHALESIR